jgi:ribose transport system substrate-binding protein
VNKYLSAPTKIGVTAPLKSAPPQGKLIVFMQCELPQCQQAGAGVKAAAAAAGWNSKIISFTNANPPSLISGMEQALAYKPAAVALTGISEAVWQGVIPAYAKAGVAIIPMELGPVTITKTVPVEISSPSDWAATGNILGDWFVADSGGKGHAVFVDVPALPVLQEYTDAAEATIRKQCPQCAVTTLNLSLAQVSDNALIPAIVSAVQRDPSVNYVLSADGTFVAGLATSLAPIGRSSVKIAGGDPSLQNEQELLDGQAAAWTGQAYGYMGWEAVDSVSRLLEGMPIPPSDGGWPLMLLTKANVGTPADDLNRPDNYEQQFKEIWHVG